MSHSPDLMTNLDLDVVSSALAAGRDVEVTVAGGSMRPTIEPGAKVVVSSAAPLVGQVVLMLAGGGFLLHRIVARLTVAGVIRFVHVGDLAGSRAGLCRPSDILGVARLPVRTPPLLRRAQLTLGALSRALIHRVARP